MPKRCVHWRWFENLAPVVMHIPELSRWAVSSISSISVVLVLPLRVELISNIDAKPPWHLQVIRQFHNVTATIGCRIYIFSNQNIFIKDLIKILWQIMQRSAHYTSRAGYMYICVQMNAKKTVIKSKPQLKEEKNWIMHISTQRVNQVGGLIVQVK